MKHFPVKSDHVASVAHESRTGLMEVKFHRGGKYQYGNVSEELFKKMVMADSIGGFFTKNIKGRDWHPVRKMGEEEK